MKKGFIYGISAVSVLVSAFKAGLPENHPAWAAMVKLLTMSVADFLVEE